VPSRSSYLLVGDLPSGLMMPWPDGERLSVADWGAAVPHLANDSLEAIVLEPRLLASCLQANLVLENLDQGVAVLTMSGLVLSANPFFRGFCLSDPIGRPYLEALTVQQVASSQSDYLTAAQRGQPVQVRLARPASLNSPFVNLSLKRVCTPNGQPQFLIAFVQNVSEEVEQQKKLDALHKAGQELSRLDADQIAHMDIPTRVELLKQNLRHYIHDLLNYDIIEVRVLDRATNELKPLLEEGMSPKAAQRILYAHETENGVTGYVAATGNSYVCPDAASDPLYLEGAVGARSSMTVPLKYLDEVVGTLNVESPRLAGFGAEDLQFTELFSKEIALALHTLDLLSAQQTCTANRSLDLVNNEVALPVDEIIAAASRLSQMTACQQDDTANQIARIINSARAMKDNIQKAGRELLVTEPSKPICDLPLQGKRVLVIESKEQARRMIHKEYERLGATVETCATACDGIAMLQAYPFDAVLMEIRPPDMGGYATYCQLKSARPGTPVSMTMGFDYDSAHAVVKARADGMRYVLFKPFIKDQLIKAVLNADPLPNAVASGKPE
jgi:two-component system, sensor histidine kinase SagS